MLIKILSMGKWLHYNNKTSNVHTLHSTAGSLSTRSFACWYCSCILYRCIVSTALSKSSSIKVVSCTSSMWYHLIPYRKVQFDCQQIFQPPCGVGNWSQHCVVTNWVINQSNFYGAIIPAKPGSVARQPNQCSTAKSRKQFRNINWPCTRCTSAEGGSLM